MIQRNKRAQTATEYLIILAVVIIIALIVVGVLGGIPGLSGNTGNQIADTYWASSADVGVQVVFSASGSHSLILKNNQEDTIRVTNLSFTSGTGSATDVILTDVTLGIGQEKALTNGTDWNTSLITTSTICPNGGDQYSAGVSVTYTKTIGGTTVSYPFNPTQTLDGTCAN